MFSAFPHGAAGCGLLLLRSSAGLALLAGGARSVGEASPLSWGGASGALAILCGGLLVTGTLTPAAGLLAAALSLTRAALPLPPVPGAFGDGPSLVLLLSMAVSVALLGPGAFSVDARLFGRREIVLPPTRARDLTRPDG